MIRTLTLTGFGFNMACGGILGLLVVHADQALGLSPADRRIGLLYSAIAVGALVATLVMPRFSRLAGQGAVSITGYAIFVLVGALLGGLTAEALGVPLTYAILAVPPAIGLAVLLASPVRGLRITP